MTSDKPIARASDHGVPDARGPTSFYLIPEKVEPGRQEPDFQRVKAMLLRRRWTILGGFLGVFGAVVVLTLLLPKKYESTASFLIEQPDARSDVPALAVLERLGRLASRETEVELIQSRRVVEPVVEAFNLHVRVETPAGPARPEDVFAGLRADVAAPPGRYELSRNGQGGYLVTEKAHGGTLWSGKPGTTLQFNGVSVDLPGPEHELGGSVRLEVIPFAQAVEETQERIEAALVQRDADLMRLTCDGRTAEDAQWLCSAISESYLSLRSELQRAEATAAADFLANQAILVKARLTAAENSLRAYVQGAQAVALQTRASEEVRQNAELWASREQLRAERAALAALIGQIESHGGGSRKYRDLASYPTFLAQDNGIIPKLVGTLVDLETRRNDLAVRRTEQDVELAALDTRIAEIETQLHSMATGYAQALETQITSLDQALESSGAVLAAIPTQQMETARYERQVTLLDKLYGFLQTRLQEAQIAQAVELPSVRVVDRASLPFEHSQPNEPLNLALGFLLASGFGLMLGLWREYSDTRVQEPKAVQDETGIPVLGMIPRLKRPGPVISVSLPAGNGHAAVTLAPEWTPERELALEAFRGLSTDLGFVGERQSGGGFHSVAVTSAGRAEGKTLTACNLAIARASHGVRTLLVDGDLRGRGMSRFLQLPLDLPGVTELASSEIEILEMVKVLKVGATNKLFVLPAGSATSHSAEFLESQRFRDFLELVKNRFDLVVVDTPPLNVVSDAAVVAAAVDGVIVVVRGGVTDRAALTLTLERLERNGAHVTGLVVNCAKLPAHYQTYSHES